MAVPSKSIARIKRTLNETLETTSASTIILFHLNIATRRTSIFSERDWADAEETSKVVWEAAKDHAQAMGGPQKFQLCTYEKDEESTAQAEVIRTCVFNVDQGLSTSDGGEMISSETPDSQGLTAHLMRHNQEMFRQHTAAVGALTHMLARTVEKQSEQIDRLMTDRMSTLVAMEDLMSRKHERDLSTLRTQNDIKNKQEVLDKVMQLAPVALNKFVGKELIRQKNSALESTVIALMETLKPQHLDAIAQSGLFNQQQLLLLGTVLEQVSKTMITADEKREQMETAHKAVNNELEPLP